MLTCAIGGGVVTSCGGTQDVVDNQASANRAKEPSVLEVRIEPVQGATYVEGAQTTVEIRGGLMTSRYTGQLTRTSIHRRLMDGEYTLRAFQRPCGGSCDTLDPPTDRCEGSFRMSGEDSPRLVEVRVTPGEPCRIAVR